MAVRIGCGSWSDDDYVGVLYPDSLPAAARLRAYAHWFERVEVNSTYYSTPAAAAVAKWVEQTPAGFLFDIKLHRFLSDRPENAAPPGALDRLFERLRPLVEARRLGAFLLTLAPRFTPERHKLEELLPVADKLLPLAPLAVELRSRRWVEGPQLEATLAFFRARSLTWVALDLPNLDAPALLPAIDEVTTPRFAYMRLHGRNPDYLAAKSAAERHAHAYTTGELKEIAERIRGLEHRAEHLHVSLNNHAQDFAPQAALALRRLLDQDVPEEMPVVAKPGRKRAPLR